ncbi:hypothetical protein [Methylotenera sp.]|uniref:hypothetical protein n=1 Tax=Methylotenera sp. TaxID=2051956 RepID=UPI0027335FC7|nr:hypothetical protein [Methylotenera sp.]MDP3308295.1 hypothetical protein [Methylotenera sp.]
MKVNINVNNVSAVNAAALETFLEAINHTEYDTKFVAPRPQYSAVYAIDGAGGYDLYFVVSDLLLQDDPSHLDGVVDDNEYLIVHGDCHTQFPHKLDHLLV